MTTWIDTGARKEDVIRETEKALLIWVHARRARDGSRQVWVPKSRVEWINTEMGFTDTLHVPAWLANRIAWA
jgi:hypothetical protein